MNVDNASKESHVVSLFTEWFAVIVGVHSRNGYVL
jgi:hypothetical protein